MYTDRDDRMGSEREESRSVIQLWARQEETEKEKKTETEREGRKKGEPML